MPEPTYSASASFTARPNAATRVALAVCSLFFLFMAVMAFDLPPEPTVAHGSSAAGGQAVLAGFFGLFVLANIAAFVWHCLVKIEVGEAGLRWRDLHGWHRADWDDIADFYLEGKQTPWLWLTTRDGRKVALERYWHHRERLQKAVIGRVGERLGLREWGLRGTRDCDLPRTFGYDPSAIRRAYLGNFLPAVMMACLCTGALLIPAKPGERITIDSPFFLILFSVSVASMLAFCLYAGREMHVPRERLREQFTARPDGFLFDDGREDMFVPWGSVVGFDFNPPRASRESALASIPRRIRTDCGQEFSFYAGLEKASHWEAIVRRCAVNGIESKIDDERGEALGGIAARWSGGVEGQGERVFSAWTRSSRMVVWSFIGIGIALLTGSFVSFFLIQEPIRPWVFTLIIAMIVGMVTAKKLLKRIRVQIGKDVVSYLRPWKREMMAWDEIERMEQEGKTVTLYRADGCRLRFDTNALAYGSQIAPLIDERLRDVRAAGSREIPALASVADR